MRHIGNNNRKQKTQAVFARTLSPPPPIPPPPPHRAERQMLASRSRHDPACAESRESAKTLQKPMRNATLRKTTKKTMRNGELSMFLDSAARRLRRFFARKHRKYRCENKTQVQFRVSKVPKLELQHMPAKKSHHSTRRQTHVLPTTTTAAAATTTPIPAAAGSAATTGTAIATPTPTAATATGTVTVTATTMMMRRAG